MSSTNRTGTSIDNGSSEETPRLSLTRETVKELRVRTGCKTGVLLLNGKGPAPAYTRTTAVCTQPNG